jgi:hypothetical protein
MTSSFVLCEFRTLLNADNQQDYDVIISAYTTISTTLTDPGLFAP